MVDAVANSGFNAAAYLDKIKGIAAAPTPAPAPAPAPAPSPSPAPAPAPAASNNLGISSEVLSLLQGFSTGSANGGVLSGLLGSASSGATSQLFQQAATQPLESAINTLKQQQANLKAQTTTLNSALSSRSAAINAYNKTLIQNAQAAVEANNGELPPA